MSAEPKAGTARKQRPEPAGTTPAVRPGTTPYPYKGYGGPETGPGCSSCGFASLSLADPDDPSSWVWTCRLAGECRFIPLSREKPQRKGRS
jgi:hypothetical protein